MMSRASDGVYTSWDEKQLDKLGDAAAVALTKVVEGKDLAAEDIRQILLILTLSFNAPRMIAIEADKVHKNSVLCPEMPRQPHIGPGLKDEDRRDASASGPHE